ncbi:MAG: hypothetical protein IPN44_00390 [Flavobacteriales bacterium]|nr:hypothetical protein [Flavobacteriales bacterium]
MSERSSPLVVSFDPDRYYLQSETKPITSPFSKADTEQFMSVTLSKVMRPKVKEALAAVITERQEAWEEGANYPPVSDLSVAWACHFIGSLPNDIPDPEVGAGPSGEVSFDWYDGPDHILSIGIQPDGTMNYAYASGNDRVHASRNLEKGLPSSLLGMLYTFKIEVLEHAAG